MGLFSRLPLLPKRRARRGAVARVALFGLFFHAFIPAALAVASDVGDENRLVEICAFYGVQPIVSDDLILPDSAVDFSDVETRPGCVFCMAHEESPLARPSSELVVRLDPPAVSGAALRIETAPHPENHHQRPESRAPPPSV